MTSKIDGSASPDALFAFDDISVEPKRSAPAPNTTSTIQPHQSKIAHQLERIDSPGNNFTSPDVLFAFDDIPVEPKRPAPPPNTTPTIQLHQPKITLQLKRTAASSPPKDIPIKQDLPKAK